MSDEKSVKIISLIESSEENFSLLDGSVETNSVNDNSEEIKSLKSNFEEIKLFLDNCFDEGLSSQFNKFTDFNNQVSLLSNENSQYKNEFEDVESSSHQYAQVRNVCCKGNFFS